MQFFKNQTALLRKSKIFNKGRYSRTRQIVKGSFFFSLILNINIVFGALFLYYLYTIKLTFIWWNFYFLISSFFFAATYRRLSKKINKVFIKKTPFNRLNKKFKNLKTYWIIIMNYFKNNKHK